MSYLANLLAQLIHLDSKTLLGFLVWGNLTAGVIIALYNLSNKDPFKSRSPIQTMAAIRFTSAFGYLCLFFRNEIPDIISANVGNSILFYCFYLEFKMLPSIVNIRVVRQPSDFEQLPLKNAYFIGLQSAPKGRKIAGLGRTTRTFSITGLPNKSIEGEKIIFIERIIVSLCIIAFNILEFLYHDPGIRIGIASCAIFSLTLPSTVLLLTGKQSNGFKRSAGFFYIPLLIALIPRGIEAFAGRIISIKTNSYYQTMMFISLALITISNTIIYLLFMKEKTDDIIEKMANYDNLTNIMNRHSFFATGKIFFEKSKEQGQTLSTLFCDIDFFKNINDQYGHQFGDMALIRFADTIKKNIRPTDLCCRYGGEEFVILANTPKEGCQIIADRILQETKKISVDSTPDFRMTTSIGCVTGIPKPEESLEDFINQADKALYRAKQTGRDRIVFYENDDPPEIKSEEVQRH